MVALAEGLERAVHCVLLCNTVCQTEANAKRRRERGEREEEERALC